VKKTTLGIPDAIFRRAKTVAAERGIFFGRLRAQGASDKKPWMKTFGKLRDLHKETVRINHIIEEEFDQIEIEDRD
jgi:hypothetical protein